MAGFVAMAAGVILSVLANTPPNTPVITEPLSDGRVVNPEDTHMETGPFSDPDVGDTHAASDWEIWTVSPSARVWAAIGMTGLERVHIHLADGVFEGSHAGRTSLVAGTNYQLRARHKDSSGEVATQWSAYAVRLFSTGQLTTLFPMETDDILSSPAPTWKDTSGVDVVLAGGGSPGSMVLESAAGGVLLSVTGGAGGNQIVNPAALAEHVAVRARLVAGGQVLTLPETDVAFTDHEGEDRTVLLPAVSLGAGQVGYYWIAANGSTYVGTAAQTQPDFTTLARGTAVPWTIAQPGYKVEVVATGLQLPTNIAIVGNPGAAADAPVMYVTELYGTIRVVRKNGTVGTYATGLLNFNPTGAFPGSGEQGVTGIVHDPVSGDVFAAMLYDAAPPNGNHYPKVVRFHSNDGGQTAATQTVIRDMVGETQGQSHQISNCSIGPDGKLYVHLGDGFTTATAQNLDSYRGKVLRMNLDGTAPTDNPFYNAGNGINARDYVFAYGFRNPFGGAWRDADGRHYEVENGPSVDRMARVNVGQNYLWDGSDASMANFALYNWNPAHAPVNIAFVQASSGGSSFPASAQGHAFVSESGPTWGTGPQTLGKRIVEFVLDANGNVTSGPTTLIEYNGSGKASCVGLAAGPDGLYFTDLYKDVDFVSPVDPGANVLRVKFVGAAEFVADVTTGPAPLTVHFTDQSNAPGPTSWLWSFGDGGTSTSQNPTHVYAADGVYNVRLTVTGSRGVVTKQKNGYIKVGQIARVALIGGSLPLPAGDAAVASHLEGLGFIVDRYDDEPANRPTAAALAANHQLVLVSSTILSANVAGEFRTVNVPLLFWEQSLLRTGRESIMDNGVGVAGTTSVDVVNTGHPITQGLSAGALSVFSSGANMSVGQGNLAVAATVLARRTGSTDVAMVVAEQGASLLGGYVAPARRAFVFFEDSSYSVATSAARQILDRAACWAGNMFPVITAQPVPVTVSAGEPVSFSVGATGAGPIQCQWRRNGVALLNGGAVTGANSTVLTINPVSAGDAGSYDVVLTAPCGTITSSAAGLTVGCYANCDNSVVAPILNANDFQCFLNRFAAAEAYANCDGSTVAPVLNANDFQCYLNAFAVGCP